MRAWCLGRARVSRADARRIISSSRYLVDTSRRGDGGVLAIPVMPRSRLGRPPTTQREHAMWLAAVGRSYFFCSTIERGPDSRLLGVQRLRRTLEMNREGHANRSHRSPWSACEHSPAGKSRAGSWFFPLIGKERAEGRVGTHRWERCAAQHRHKGPPRMGSGPL